MDERNQWRRMVTVDLVVDFFTIQESFLSLVRLETQWALAVLNGSFKAYRL